MEQETLDVVSELGDLLGSLFQREADALMDAADPKMVGRREAYEACAEACYKATTRKLIVFPECRITFTVPREAKP